MLMRYDDVKSAKPNLIQAPGLGSMKLSHFFSSSTFFEKFLKIFILIVKIKYEEY